PEATLVHLAECRDIQRYAESPQIAEVQKAILQKLLRKPYARVIYASSLTAGRDFGLASVPPYVVYKRAAESMVLEQRGIALRFTNLYGPGGMAENTVLMELLAQLRSEAATPLTVINSAAYIDLLHVEDAAQAIVQAILASQKELNVIARFDIASQRPITVRQLAEKMAEIAGQTGRAIQSKTDRPNSPVQTDGANAKKWLGWSPTISLEEGLHTLLDGAS
ncbi:MAG: NAD(P)-dependent oxidoreductase, partial [Alphaproteobacteria bacterium]|nr:NAD(P)-dependent oxidoreductase [Alphaproteobacteria bacterium]